MEIFKKLLVIIAIGTMLSGCGSSPSMEHVIKATDETIDSEIENSAVPVVIFTHKDASDDHITAAGPVLNQFAIGLKDQFTFMTYPYKTNGKWMAKHDIRGYGSFHLFIDGKEVKKIKSPMIRDRKVSVTAILFDLIKDEIIPKDEAASSKGVTRITAKDFQSKVLDSPQTVILAFDNCSGGRAISFNPNYSNLSKELGGLADFLITKDPDLLDKCGLTVSPSVAIYSNGEKVSEYTGQMYDGKGKDHIVLHQLLPFMPYTDVIFIDEE